MISVGDKAPEFNVSIEGDAQFALANAIDKNLILYFYRKDDTPGCTKDTIDLLEKFDAQKTIIFEFLGILERNMLNLPANIICEFILFLIKMANCAKLWVLGLQGKCM